MATFTKTELEALFPFGEINIQVDDEIRPMTQQEWDEWIDSQVGIEKNIIP